MRGMDSSPILRSPTSTPSVAQPLCIFAGICSALILGLSVLIPINDAVQAQPPLVAMGPQGFVYPVMAPRRSSGYGMRVHPIRRFSRLHQGIDLAAPEGSPIRAVQAGVVVFADPYAGYGNLVVIQHQGRITTHYGHCQSLRVKPGQRVNAGQIIATVGNTGHSTGPHLHFELRKSGQSVDPENAFPNLAAKAQG